MSALSDTAPPDSDTGNWLIAHLFCPCSPRKAFCGREFDHDKPPASPSRPRCVECLRLGDLPCPYCGQ